MKYFNFLTMISTLFLSAPQANAGPRVIVFDLGDVILKLDWDKPLSLMGIRDETSKGVFKKVLTSHEGAYDQFERGEMNEKRFFAEFKKNLSLSCDTDTIKKAWESLIVGPVDGIEDVISRIPKNYDLYLLTNASENVYQYLKLGSAAPLYPILSKFKKIYTSFQLKARKPEREIYDRVLQDLRKDHKDLLASDVFFIDDRNDNVEGAIRAGWRGEKSNPVDAKSVEEILKRHGVH